MAVGIEASMLAESRAAAAQARRYLTSKPHGGYTDGEVRDIVDLYYDVCEPVGLDPLLAISQMSLETGHLSSFWSQPPRRNPAGIGVTGIAGQGLSFPSWAVAVRAHVGRLLAYALPTGKGTSSQVALMQEALAHRPLPPHLRGVAPALRNYGNGIWAAAGGYAEHIAKIANEILAEPIDGKGAPAPEKDKAVTSMFTFGVRSVDPTRSGVWLLAGDGRAHHVPGPDDWKALGTAVQHLGDVSEDFLLRFERIHPALANLPDN